ncbi:TonB-dependent siderophore receptor [Halomonas cerina]|uniref:Iron complex outermembrane receptor protein n=1 Tax=Halomonas cerina TaxID=447424 RepID=A0A839VCM4_9GAMM|nr:TonB-dependent siderophore receptor [Halomonas cerina]MBB3191755.1 iron complex outermembrane receptor protein [Halomonas cerina]
MPTPRPLALAVSLVAAGTALAAHAEEAEPLSTLTVTAEAATKTETPFNETPQSVSVIENEEWEARGAETVQRAAAYTPGVYTNQVGASNRYDYLVLRGFTDGSVNNTFLDGLKVMSDGGSFSSLVIDPYFLERIEVVKGPASVLYGRASPGGLVAQTRKRPEFERGGELRVGAGNNAQRSAAFDLTGPLDDERRLAFRLTGLARAADTQFGPVEEERYAFAPQLTWDMTDATSLTLHAYLHKDPEGGYHSGLPFEGTVVDHAGRRIANTFFEGEEDFDTFERDQYMVGYELEHRFHDTLTGRQKLRYTDADVELEQVYAFGWASDTELNRFFSSGDESLQAFTVDNQLEARLSTGAAEHTLLAGVDYQQLDNDVVWGSGMFPTIDAFDPEYGAEPIAMFPDIRRKRELEQTGVYLQDQLALGNWRVNLGGRHDWVDISNTDRDSGAESELDDTQFSGRAGVLYLFDNGLAPYASYTTSFSPNSATDQNGDLIEPSQGEQVETGLKFQPAGTQDRYSLALFHITQENLATKRASETFFRATGEIESRGVELEAHTQLTDNLRLQAGYSYTDVTLEKTDDANEGNTDNWVPRHQASVWGQYAFQQDGLAGLDAGLGVRYYADIYADEANTEKVPDYTVVDATLGYDLTEVGLEGVSARLNVNNLLDEDYVAGCSSINFCYFGAERSVKATVSYAF